MILSPEYEDALEASRVASRIYDKAAAKYRAMEIGDDEFGKAQVALKAANAIFDVAFFAEQDRPEEVADVEEDKQTEMEI
jgi:hypothetical protein